MESQDEDYGDTVSDEGSTCSSCIDIDKLICVAESALDDSGFIRSAKGSKMSTPSSRSLMHPEAYIVPCSKCTWDIFLSHKQSNAQDAMQSLRMALGERMPSSSFWLDIEQDPTVQGMCHGMMEMRWALQAQKNIILVSETDERHGKPDLGELIQKCPGDLKHVFEEHVIIPWFRDPEIRSVCVTKILKKCVFEVDAERTSITSKLQRPLMFSNNAELMSLASSEEQAVQVIDQSFVFFTSFWGIALPGASTCTRRFAVFVTFLVLACGAVCFSRIFHQQGPSWLDAWTWTQNVVAHPVVFLLLQVMLSILRSESILDLLENHIDCNRKILCCAVSVLTLAMAGLTCWGFLPGFLHPDYIGALGNDQPDHRFVYGIVHSFAFVVVLPIMFGSGFSAMVILMLIQELCFMAFTTNLQRLNPDLSNVKLDSTFASTAALSVEEGDLARFKIGFLKTWQLQKKIHRRIAIPYTVFWVCQLAALPWSVISLSQGFAADFSDERLERLRQHQHLQVRLWAIMLVSPWFGIEGYIFGFWPWLNLYYHQRFFNLTKQMIFTKMQVETAFRSFLRDFELHFSAYAIHATAAMLPLYFSVLLVNTLGNVAGGVRVLRALWELRT